MAHAISVESPHRAVQGFICALRDLLERHQDPERIQKGQRFFKNTLKGYGIEGGTRQVAKFVAQAIGATPGDLTFEVRMQIAQQLFSSRMYEEGQAATILLKGQTKRFTKQTLSTFTRWIEAHIDNWGVCDSFCTAVVYQVIEKAGAPFSELLAWADADNLWLRRAACATMTKLCRNGAHATSALQLVDRLLPREQEPLIQKGIGWVLKVLSRHHHPMVLDYLCRHPYPISTFTLNHALQGYSTEERQRVRSQQQIVGSSAEP
jgi:3-methyladenine DNA glycosylase AlkD